MQNPGYYKQLPNNNNNTARFTQGISNKMTSSIPSANEYKRQKVNYPLSGNRAFSSRLDDKRDKVSHMYNMNKNDSNNFSKVNIGSNVNSNLNSSYVSKQGSNNYGNSQIRNSNNSNNTNNRYNMNNSNSYVNKGNNHHPPRPFSSMVGKKISDGNKIKSPYSLYAVKSIKSTSKIRSSNNANNNVNDSVASSVNRNDISASSFQIPTNKILSNNVSMIQKPVNSNIGVNNNNKNLLYKQNTPNQIINKKNFLYTKRSLTPNIIRKDGTAKLGYGNALQNNQKNTNYRNINNSLINSSRPLTNDKSSENINNNINYSNLNINLNKSMDVKSKSTVKNRNFPPSNLIMGVKGIGSSLVKSPAYNKSSATVNTTSMINKSSNSNNSTMRGAFGVNSNNNYNNNLNSTNNRLSNNKETSPYFNGYKMRVFGQNKSASKRNFMNNNFISKKLENSTTVNSQNRTNLNSTKIRSTSNNSNNKSLNNNLNFKQTFMVQNGNKNLNTPGSISNKSNVSSNLNKFNIVKTNSTQNSGQKSHNFNNKSNIAHKNAGKVQYEFYDDHTDLKTNPSNTNKDTSNSRRLNNSNNNQDLIDSRNYNNNPFNNNKNNNIKENSNNASNYINVKTSDINSLNDINKINVIDKGNNINNVNSLVNSTERSNKFVSSNNHFEGKTAKDILKENDTSPFPHYHWKKLDPPQGNINKTNNNDFVMNNKGINNIPNNNNDFSPSKFVVSNNTYNAIKPSIVNNNINNIFVNNYNRNSNTPEKVKKINTNDFKKPNLNSRISLVEQQGGNLLEEINLVNNVVPSTYSKKAFGNNPSNINPIDPSNQVYSKIKQNNTYLKSNTNNTYQFQNNDEQDNKFNQANISNNNKISSLEQPSGSEFIDGLFNSPELKSLLSGKPNNNNIVQNPNTKQSNTNISNNNINNAENSEILEMTNKKSKGNITTNQVCKKIKILKDYTQTGHNGVETKKNNQDIAIIYPNFNGINDNYFFSVCDGHGVLGHEVSRYLKSTLPVNLESELKKKKLNVFSGEQKLVYKVVEDMFNFTNNNLNATSIETEFSGSTCVSMFFSPDKVVTANIGDSRAVMGKFSNGGKSH